MGCARRFLDDHALAGVQPDGPLPPSDRFRRPARLHLGHGVWPAPASIADYCPACHIDLNPKRAWNIFAGLVWGLACWTSLFEPPIIFAVVVLFNLVARRRESTAMLISFGFVMLIALLLEGVHIYNVFGLSPDYRHYLVNWLNTIGEIRGISFAALVDQMTLVLVALPFLAWALVIRENGRTTDIFLVVLTTILFTLTVLQSRWIYYSSFSSSRVLARRRWTGEPASSA
jgi:hypothetical protein